MHCFSKFNLNFLHKNRTCLGSSRWNGISLVSVPGMGSKFKSQTYTVAFAPAMTGLGFMRKFRLFLGQCEVNNLYMFFISVFTLKIALD